MWLTSIFFRSLEPMMFVAVCFACFLAGILVGSVLTVYTLAKDNENGDRIQ